jgi:hypothetical protein
VFVTVGRFAERICSGNLWFVDCVFAGVILSFLKLGKRQNFESKRAVMPLGSPGVVLCAYSLLGLCLYALHKNAVTIDAFCVALFALRLLRGDRGLPVRVSIHEFVYLLRGVRSTLLCVCCDAEYQHS